MRNLRHLDLIRAHHSFIDPMASFLVFKIQRFYIKEEILTVENHFV